MSTLADYDRGAVAELLLREMETRNWSQREMAKACQLSNTTISKIVRGQSVPDPNTCFKLAQGLALPAPYVLQMAGHEIAQVQTKSPSLEALLHAQFDRLPERAIQEMIGALRAIENTYIAPSSEDHELAQEKLDNLELIRRWVDPIKRQALTVVQGGNFLFYQTADLDEQGYESNRSELLPIEEDVSRLSTFPMLKFANSFCVQLYPLCEFDAHHCRSHPLHAVLFTPIYAGDRGTGVTVIYPDGRQFAIHDQVTEQVWRKIYADLTTAGNTPPQLAPDQDQVEAIADHWRSSNPDELWINPDTRTYAAFFASPNGDTTYYLLTGPISEMQAPDWRVQSAERIEVVDAALHGRFETSIVHLQGFCLQIYPEVEHITATRHVVPAHRVLSWQDAGEEQDHVCVMHSYLETWLHIAIRHDGQGQVSVTVLEDTAIHADDARQRFEEQRQQLRNNEVVFSDSQSPQKAQTP